MPDKNEIIKSFYKSYFSEKNLTVLRKDFYTDVNGYPNKAAFENFAESLYETEDGDTETTVYYLICLNVNLRKSNAISLAMGDYVLRKFFVDVQSRFENAYIFRIQGEKFNILVKDSDYLKLKKFLDEKNDAYEIYYGCTKERYIYTRNTEMIQKSVTLMYQNKLEKKNANKVKSRMIVGNTENTPVELQETDTRKYLSTMWFSVIKVTILKPFVKDFTIYVYPTKYCKPLESIPLVVVIDDIISYRAEYGANLVFGVDGVIFMLNARFNREGHLMTSIYATDDGTKAECKYDINTTEGKYLPVTFGKRLDNGRELYPVKRNIHGYFDYVIYDPELLKDAQDNINNKLEVNDTGIVAVNGKRYGVTVDDECIDLVEQ